MEFAVELRPAQPLLLHRPPLSLTYSNSPVLMRDGHTLAFVSHYQPLGHTLRCAEAEGLWPNGPWQAVRIADDPAPGVGKWIQSVWRAPDGTLFGWYHAEELAPCTQRVFLPHLGALQSTDEGCTWRLLGELLRAPLSEADCSYQNGFLAGGYGDFCVVPDQEGEWFYLHYSSYGRDESSQGISVARYLVAARRRPDLLQIWRGGAWRRRKGATDATPILPVDRAWKHRDPAAFWGPAIHYNRAIGQYVMLLNRTENGAADIVQRGVYVSFNADLASPVGWSVPLQIIEDGSWYPQAIGLGPDDGDTSAGEEARFFMSGYSAWTIRFRSGAALPPLKVTRETFAETFGVGPW